MNKTSHTPTPWRFEESTMTLRSVPSNYWISSMNSFDGAVNHKENAAFIVRAVNAHEALLKAAKAMAELSPISSDSKWALALLLTHQAIKLAEGGK